MLYFEIEINKNNSLYNDTFITTLKYGQHVAGLLGLQVDGVADDLIKDSGFQDDLNLMACQSNLELYLTP